MSRLILSLAGAACLLTVGLAAAADDTSSFAGVDKLPAGYRAIDGFVAGSGIPYTAGDMSVLPVTTYWVYHDKIIGYEVTIDQKQIKAGVSLLGITAVPGLPPVDHIDLEHSDGHDWFPLSTWTVRVEFVSNYYLEHMMML